MLQKKIDVVSETEFRSVLLGSRVNIILFNYDVNFAGHMKKTDGQQLGF